MTSRFLPLALSLPALVAASCGLEAAREEEVSASTEALRRSGYNPVLRNCADPGVMRHRGRWYAACTGAGFPMHVSDDMVHWRRLGRAFPVGGGPRWSEGNHWAPELHHVPGGFALYYSALHRGRNVLGVAFSERPEGPFVDRGRPLLQWRGSIIDAHVTKDARGRLYLFFKSERRTRSGRQNDAIFVRPLARSGLALGRARSRRALGSTRGWEGGVVEAPWIVRRGGWFHLIYSGSTFCNAKYALGAARRRGSPYGAFRARARPIQKSGRRWLGPGHNSVATGPDGRRYLLFHAYDRAQGVPRCRPHPADNDARHVLIRRLIFRNGWPRAATGAPGSSARRSAFVAGVPSGRGGGSCGAATACTDDLGRDVCAGSEGILTCAGGVTRCTCSADGHFEGCGACVPR